MPLVAHFIVSDSSAVTVHNICTELYIGPLLGSVFTPLATENGKLLQLQGNTMTHQLLLSLRSGMWQHFTCDLDKQVYNYNYAISL